MAISIEVNAGQILLSQIKGKSFKVDNDTEISFPEELQWEWSVPVNGTTTLSFTGRLPRVYYKTSLATIEGFINSITFNGTTTVLKVQSLMSLGLPVSIVINSNWKMP